MAPLNIIDNRFPEPGIDARFAEPGVDWRFKDFPDDNRFPEPGIDRRWMGGPWGEWMPDELFKNGEQGWLMDLSLASMFQDAAGTIPVTEPGQPVGLVLDKSKGGPGPELVTNGSFDSGLEGWSKGAGVTNPISWEPSRLVLTNDLAYYASAVQTVTGLTVGRWYEISGDYVSATGSPVSRIGVVRLAGAMAAGTPGGAGKLTLRFAASATVHQISLSHGTNVLGQVSYFDNISVRELPGNHWTQPTALNRPIYGREPKTGRRNLMTWTEDMSSSLWTAGTNDINATSFVCPRGGKVFSVVPNANASSGHYYRRQESFTTDGQYTYSRAVKADGYNYYALAPNNSTSRSAWFNLTTGAASSVGAEVINAHAENIGDGWWLVSVTVPAGTYFVNEYVGVAPNWSAFAGDGTSGVLIGAVQAERGPDVTPYQRVTTAFDVTEAGVPSVNYLSFNGTNQWMQTAAFDWGGDEVTQVVGARKLSDAALGLIFEFSQNFNNYNGSFACWNGTNASGGASYRLAAKGSALTQVTPAGVYASPITNLLSGSVKISTDTAQFRINGALAGSSGGDQGEGSFGNYPLFIGARNGTATFFNGNFYPTLGINRLLSEAELANAEAWVAERTGGLTL